MIELYMNENIFGCVINDILITNRLIKLLQYNLLMNFAWYMFYANFYFFIV